MKAHSAAKSKLSRSGAWRTAKLRNELFPIHFNLSAAGVVLSVNPAGAKSLGYEAEHLVGKPIADLFYAADRSKLQRYLADLITGSGLDLQQELRLIDSLNQPLLRNLSGQVMQGASGETTLLLTCSVRRESESVEAALQQQTAWEKLIRTITHEMHQALDLRQILHATAAKLQQLLQVDRVIFYRIHPDGKGRIVAEGLAAHCPTAAQDSTALELDSSAPAQALPPAMPGQAGEERPHWPPPLPVLPDAELVQSEMTIPIQQQDSLWGWLMVQQRSSTYLWKEWEMKLLQQLATQLEGVIQQAELYHQVQRLNADLERQIQVRTAQLQLAFDFEATLKRITDKVRDSLNEDQILETAVQELVYAIGVNCCNAAIYDLEQGTSTIRYEHTTTSSPYQGRVSQMGAFPELYEQLYQGRSFQFCSLIPNPVRGRVATLTCPIFDDGGVLGDLWLINQPYYCFSEQDIRLVQQVANQCAIAIRQARLYKAAQIQVEELAKLNRLKDDFLSTVSHELRTPMTNIKMAAQMLEVVLQTIRPKDTPTQQRLDQYFQILQNECQRETSLINNLLDLSRLDAQEAVLRPEAIDPAPWLTQLSAPFAELTRSRQQQFEIQLPPAMPRFLTDKTYLDRVVTELLNNACKYTPKGETIAIAIALQATAPNCLLAAQSQHRSENEYPAAWADPEACLEIRVRNSGVTIPAEELAHVFDKFYRIPNNDPWQYGGTGLGLALVRKLVGHMNGKIEVNSTSGATCFTVKLPVTQLLTPTR